MFEEPRFEAVGKPGGGVRILTRLSDADSAAYSSAVAEVAPAIERALGPEAMADRAVCLRSGQLRSEHWRPAYERLNLNGRRLLADRGSTHLLLADVRDCFVSIQPDVLRGRLVSIGAPGPAVEVVMEQIRDFAEKGVGGLPIGPTPSAVLANAVLEHADSALRIAGIRFLRWVDDVMIFTDSRLQSDHVRALLTRSWREVGLEMNETKTRTVRDRDEAASIFAISAGARMPSFASR